MYPNSETQESMSETSVREGSGDGRGRGRGMRGTVNVLKIGM